MQAGVLSYWLCDQDYRCESCPLDAAIRHAGVETGASQNVANSEPPPRRGEPRSADRAEPASKTPRLASTAVGVATGLLDLRLPELDSRLRYHATHTWVRFGDGARVRVGIDPFASRIAGPLRSVVLPQPGTRVRRGHPCAWLDEEGGTLTVLSPVSGVIVEVNASLATSPEPVARDPLGAGWLLELEASDLEMESHRLVAAGEFERRVESDVERWRHQVCKAVRRAAPPVGLTLADGGARVTDVGQLIGARRRHEIAASFLCTPGARK
jgi:glycine cleavage system H protein